MSATRFAATSPFVRLILLSLLTAGTIPWGLGLEQEDPSHLC